MRRFSSVVLSLSSLATFAACGDDTDPGPIEPGTAEIRVVHGSPDAPAVDVYVAGSADPVITDLEYGEASAYLEVPEGTYAFEVRPAGAEASSEPVHTTGELELAEGDRVTALAAGYVGSTAGDDTFRVIPLAEGFDTPGTDEAIVRVVHASPDAPAVAIDVGNDGTPEVEDLGRFADTGAAGIALPANTPIAVGIWAGSPLARVTAFTTPALPAGAELFVIASGNLSDLPRQDTGFSLLAVGPAGTITSVKQDPTVMVFHGSPDAPAVDVLAGTAVLAGDLAFGELSAPIQVPPGEYDLAVNAAGTSTTAATISTPALEAGGRYLAIATGFLGSNGADGFQPLYAVDAFDLDADSARLAVIHASPDAPAVDVGPATPTSMTGTPPIIDLAFTEATAGAGLELPAASYTFGVAATGSTTPVATFDIALTNGLRAFAIAAGALAPSGSEASFALHVVNTSVWPWTVAAVAPN